MDLTNVKSSENDRSDGPPVRRTLTDPPTVLRQAARGGQVQRDFQGKVDRQEHDANPINWFIDSFKSRDDE